tara:strand:+ start:358 stop:546 length:189 start_codon:yes stop_codon:yes gene_type:complete
MRIIPFQKSAASPGIAQFKRKSRLKRFKEALLLNRWPVLSYYEQLEEERLAKLDKLIGTKKK